MSSRMNIVSHFDIRPAESVGRPQNSRRRRGIFIGEFISGYAAERQMGPRPFQYCRRARGHAHLARDINIAGANGRQQPPLATRWHRPKTSSAPSKPDGQSKRTERKQKLGNAFRCDSRSDSLVSTKSSPKNHCNLNQFRQKSVISCRSRALLHIVCTKPAERMRRVGRTIASALVVAVRLGQKLLFRSCECIEAQQRHAKRKRRPLIVRGMSSAVPFCPLDRSSGCHRRSSVLLASRSRELKSNAERRGERGE